MEIGANAGHENRRHVLMQFYDEVMRKEWAEKAQRGDEHFSVNKACVSLDLNALAHAKNEYDAAFAKRADTAAATRQSFSDKLPHWAKRFSGVCCSVVSNVLTWLFWLCVA